MTVWIGLKLLFTLVLLKAKPNTKNLKLRTFSSGNIAESQGGKGIYNINDDGQGSLHVDSATN